MKSLVTFLLVASCCFGQSDTSVNASSEALEAARPAVIPGLESIKAELALARAQLEQLRLEFQYQMQVCQAADVMRARLSTIDAQAKAAKPAVEPKR